MVKMTNPLSDKQFGKLVSSIEWSDTQLEYPKKKRIQAIKEFAGYHYFSGGADQPVPVNSIKLITSIFLRLLAARAPRALFSTKHEGLKPTAANLELAVNEIPKEINLRMTLKRVVAEALLGFGVVKCGLTSVGEVMGHDYGAPFVDVIPMDDLVIDMVAKHMDTIQYIGNTYWMVLEEVMESDWFPKKNKKDLSPDEYEVIGEAGEARAEGIAQDSNATLFKKKVKLRDVYLPTEDVMVTYAVKSKRRLKVFEWEGPERGPYHMLGFDWVPGNLLPLPPVAIWRDLHELGNNLFSKLGEEAESQKTVQGFQGGDGSNVENFKQSRDGDGIEWSGAEPKLLKAGGIDPGTLAFFLQVKDLASYYAGNVDAAGGLAIQSETLGQDRLLNEASSAQIREAASEVVEFTKGIFRALAYYEWHDPVRRRILQKKIPGTEMGIAVPWDRNSRQGRFNMYDLDIDVYSLQDDSPGLKLQKLEMLLSRFVLPLMPAIQQMNGTLDVQTILKQAAKFADFPELDDMVQFIQETELLGDKAQPPGMAANTTRTNVRVNRPGATDRGKSQILQQALLGGRPQGSEAASLGRPSG